MTKEPTSVIVLAAGKGTRMRSELPKVLHQVHGRPMIHYAVSAAQGLEPDQIIVVIGYGADAVRTELGETCDYAVQEPQLGTGHAVQVAVQHLRQRTGDVLVTYGDMPLLSTATLAHMREVRRQHACAATLLTAHMNPPPAYGRIVRDNHGEFDRIVEERDCSPAQKAITEVNIAVYCFDVERLLQVLGQLTTENAQGEYYLTDALGLLRQAGERVVTVSCQNAFETLGINDLTALAQVEKVMAETTKSPT